MSKPPQVSDPALFVAHSGWRSPLTRPLMSNGLERHTRTGLTNRFVERDGNPFIPVSGEMHYSRIPRAEWAERLNLMKSGGITAVASYVFWIHHEEVRGRVRFEDDLDIRAFVEMCGDRGLDVVLRLGPWCHGETRNGGFPDWVQQAPVVHRTDDPRYLDLVRTWFAAISAELTGLFGPDSPIIAIQIENELYDQPDHILTLKEIARAVGMSAPIWTATGWGGAELPETDVMPLFGGYADGFWVDHDAPWDVTFREHFFFSHVWDDPGIGADLRDHGGIGGGKAVPPARTPSALFPAATCELGGGMSKAYHRRPQLAGRDIAAVAHNKIGNGSAWQGYYMYAGGVNPDGSSGMQESHATSYPNDLARFDYDFGAPIGATGRLSAAHALLRRQHAFLRAFGDLLAPMPSTLPAVTPRDVDDVDTLRWAIRSDGTSGFVFISWHQPFIPLEEYANAQFAIRLDESTTVEFPDRPVSIPAGTLAHWPVNLTIGGVTIAWATASALTVLPGDVPTLVLVAETGIEPRVAKGPGVTVAETPAVCENDGVIAVDPSVPTVIRTVSSTGRLDVLIIPAGSADDVWVLDGVAGRTLLLSSEPLWQDGDRLGGRHTDGLPAVRRYDAESRSFISPQLLEASAAVPCTPVAYAHTASTGSVPPTYGARDGRASAPTGSDYSDCAESFVLTVPDWARQEGEIVVAWAGDTARILVDGTVVADQFWSGVPWIVDLGSLRLRQGARVELQILPLHPEAPVHVPSSAEARRRGVDGPLWAVDSIEVARRGRWNEATS